MSVVVVPIALLVEDNDVSAAPVLSSELFVAGVNGPTVGVEVGTLGKVWMFEVSLVEDVLIGVRVVSDSGSASVELILAAVVGATIGF